MLVIGWIRKRIKDRDGFTMVELIVVIVIILVLAAVLVPSLLKYIDKAQQAKCKADAATLLTQIQADYAACQAEGHPILDEFYDKKIGNVKVTYIDYGDINNEVKVRTAQFVDQATAGGYKEITAFIYNNGQYMAIWRQESGWKLQKSPNHHGSVQ